MNETYPLSFRVSYKSVTTGHGGFTPVISNVTVFRNWSNTRSGVDNPLWRRQIASGGDATTDFAGFRQTHRHGYCYALNKVKVTGGTGSDTTEVVGQFPSNGFAHGVTSASSSTALDTARRVLIQRAKKEISPFQGGAFLGELRESLRMIRQPAMALRKKVDGYLMRAKKLARGPKNRKTQKALAGTYLEATFGWNPLIQDVNSAASALEDSPTYGVVVITAKGQSEGASTVSGGFTSGLVLLKFEEITKELQSVWLKAGFRVSIPGATRGLAGQLGFLPEQFVPTLYEIAPYSWLIDYFTNVGTIIDAWSFLQSRVVWSSKTTKRIQVTKRCNFVWNDPVLAVSYPPSIQRQLNVSHPVVRSTTVGRSRLGSIVPDLAFRLPGFGSLQSLNVAALLWAKQR